MFGSGRDNLHPRPTPHVRIPRLLQPPSQPILAGDGRERHLCGRAAPACHFLSGSPLEPRQQELCDGVCLRARREFRMNIEIAPRSGRFHCCRGPGRKRPAARLRQAPVGCLRRGPPEGRTEHRARRRQCCRESRLRRRRRRSRVRARPRGRPHRALRAGRHSRREAESRSTSVPEDPPRMPATYRARMGA